MKKILITGAGSYIGTSFEKYMEQFGNNYSVDTVDMIGDSWKSVNFSGYDCVFHVAGIAHSDNGKISKEKEKLYYAVNTDLTVETAKKAKADGVKQFIFMSSAIVYGNSAPIGKGKRITKDTPVHPANCYGDSKVQAEKGLRKLEDENFKVVILRPPMIYGKGSKGNYPLMSKMAQKLPIFPYVKNRRSMLYIDNLCEFVRLMIENNEQGTFWPQNREYSNTSEMVRMIGAAHGKKVHLIKGFTWSLKLLGLATGIVDKAFGNLYYDKSISVYKQNYRVCSLEESIKRTEQNDVTKNSKKRKALMLASVASMIDQFNIPNIEILQSLGYDVTVVADFVDPGTITVERAEELKKRLNNMGVKVIHIAIPRTLNPKAIFTAYRAVKKLINIEKYDLIHCHSPIGGAICRLAARKARKHGSKVIYTAHGFHFYDGAPKKNWIVYYPIEKFLSRYTDVLITINKEDYNRALKKFRAHKTVYVPGIGVDVDKFANVCIDRKKKRSELGLTDNDIMILSVGELNENKNHSVIIKALGRIKEPRIHYFIAGKGSLDHYLMDLAVKHNVNLHLLGFRTDVAELYKCADICAFTSIREGLGLAWIEGMASGLPLIVANNRGTREYVFPENGYMCKYNDIQGFAYAINKLSLDENERMEKGNHNQMDCMMFSSKIINKIMRKLYNSICL